MNYRTLYAGLTTQAKQKTKFGKIEKLIEGGEKRLNTIARDQVSKFASEVNRDKANKAGVKNLYGEHFWMMQSEIHIEIWRV